MKMKIFCLSLLIIIIVFLDAVSANGGNSANVKDDDSSKMGLTWAIIRHKPNNTCEAIHLQRNVSVTSEDLFCIFIQPGINTYVYLYFYDSAENLQLVFPNSIGDFDDKDKYTFEKSYIIPTKGKYFCLDENKGASAFYLLASRQRLHGLEALTYDYFNTSGDENAAIKEQIFTEMKNVKKIHSKFASFAEKPTPTAGTISLRSEEDPNVAKLATHVEAVDFYSKTIFLEHD